MELIISHQLHLGHQIKMMEDPTGQEGTGNLFEQSMKEALAHLDQVTREVQMEKEKAIDEQIAAKALRTRIEKDAHAISEAYIEKHRNEYVAQLRKEIWLEVVMKLILSGLPSFKIKQALELSPEQLADAWAEIGFEPMGDRHIGHVRYHSEGRAGHVIFYREDVVARFYYEFGGHDLLAYIMVPTEENWVAETGIPLEERMEVLEFVAARVIRDQAPGHTFRITRDAIYIE